MSKVPLTRNNIPAWCNIRHNNLSACSREKAGYVLGHITYDIKSSVGGFGAHRVGNNSVRSVAVKCEDFWLLYVKTTHDATLLPPMIRRALSVAYSQVDGYDYSDWQLFRYLRREFKVDRKMITHARVGTGPRPEEFPRATVTGEHHTHFRPEEVWEVSKKYRAKLRAMSVVYNNLKKIEGVTEAVVSTMFLYILFARPQTAYLFACSAKIWSVRDINGLSDILKTISTPLKSVQNNDLCDVTQLFELQCLVNRGIGKVDWRKERANREKPNVVIVDEKKVYHEAMNLFRMGISHGYKYARMDLNKYVKSRWEWVPSGSVHSQYEEDEPYIKKSNMHRTKFVTVNMLSRAHIRRIFARKKEIHAWASVKYEWAKQRAIYGVDLTSSIITNFAMFRCEEVFKHRFPVGEEAAASRVHKRLKMMLDGNESFCYDFDDFNAQHSTGSMYAVLQAYMDVFRGSMSRDQVSAMEWVRDSILSVKVHNHEEGREEFYKTDGTLLSGWRLTTFMNTALNYIYFKLAGAFDVTGVRDSVHNGDDVLVAIRDIRSACSIHGAMARINARAQATKCNVFSVGEFLRVEHKVTREEGLGAQYLTRAAATLAHSRIESQEPTRLVDSIKGMVTRCEEITARSFGMETVAYELLTHSVRRLCGIFGVQAEDGYKVLKGHTLVGGAMETFDGSIKYKIREEVLIGKTVITADNRHEYATLKDMMPGILDYAEILNNQYGDYIPIDNIKKKIIYATHRQLEVTRGTRLIVTDVQHDDKYKYGRALFRMYKGLITIPYVEKARFLGIPPIAMLSHSSMKFVTKLISSVKDVDYTLRTLL
ncbi:putative RNA-dependent RNA polymerase [Panax notoginseng virus A]|uniref:RNA-directed RNA polymerase n=1 Tax=Panax notoginseng virus A TaxID=1777016 RepID=A0A0U4DRM0_9VIRU|nr:putative RNA-dependent RNA polymerase [Panax notoginseng virus A]ALX17420.1 putative RNA-dependent RNA polymerase [Panax notoginseng virus A]